MRIYANAPSSIMDRNTEMTFWLISCYKFWHFLAKCNHFNLEVSLGVIRGVLVLFPRIFTDCNVFLIIPPYIYRYVIVAVYFIGCLQLEKWYLSIFITVKGAYSWLNGQIFAIYSVLRWIKSLIFLAWHLIWCTVHILWISDFKIPPPYQSQIGHSNFVAYLQFHHVPKGVPQKTLCPILTLHMWT